MVLAAKNSKVSPTASVPELPEAARCCIAEVQLTFRKPSCAHYAVGTRCAGLRNLNRLALTRMVTKDATSAAL